MATPINRPPVGFNEFLQLQTKGLNPNQLSDQVLCTIDYESFIRNNIELRCKNTSFTFSDADDGTFIAASLTPVPEGDLWVVIGICTFISDDATSAFNVMTGLSSPLGTPGNEFFFSQTDLSMDGNPKSNAMTGHNFSPYLWVPSGNVFGVWVNDGGSPTVRNGRLRILHYRYKK